MSTTQTDTTPAKVLIVEDEKPIRRFIRVAMEEEACQVIEAETMAQGLLEAGSRKPDLLVLDLGLPDMDGKDVLGELRRGSSMPVLVLSVRAGDSEKVLCLDGGANDYVTKPFSIPEFLARVRVLLRQPIAAGVQEASVRCGPLQIDLASRRVSLDDQDIGLTRKEFAVLATLARQLGRVVTQQQLLTDIWGPTHVADSHYLRVVVGHLRQKLGDNPADPHFIVTEAGIGYRLREQSPGASQ